MTATHGLLHDLKPLILNYPSLPPTICQEREQLWMPSFLPGMLLQDAPLHEKILRCSAVDDLNGMEETVPSSVTSGLKLQKSSKNFQHNQTGVN